MCLAETLKVPSVALCGPRRSNTSGPQLPRGPQLPSPPRLCPAHPGCASSLGLSGHFPSSLLLFLPALDPGVPYALPLGLSPLTNPPPWTSGSHRASSLLGPPSPLITSDCTGPLLCLPLKNVCDWKVGTLCHYLDRPIFARCLTESSSTGYEFCSMLLALSVKWVNKDLCVGVWLKGDNACKSTYHE